MPLLAQMCEQRDAQLVRWRILVPTPLASCSCDPGFLGPMLAKLDEHRLPRVEVDLCPVGWVALSFATHLLQPDADVRVGDAFLHEIPFRRRSSSTPS